VDLVRADSIFGRMAENGANFARVWVCCHDWALAIEAEKSAWRRTWARGSAIVPDPEDPARTCLSVSGDDGATVRFEPCNPVALRPGTDYRLTGRVRTDGTAGLAAVMGADTYPLARPGAARDAWASFDVTFPSRAQEYWLPPTAFRLQGSGTAWLGSLSLTEAAGGPELLIEAETNRREIGFCNPVDCFMLDRLVESAEAHGIYLMPCVITRDLYMDRLRDPASDAYRQATRDAMHVMRYAVARWGYSTSIAAWEYFNEIDPGCATDGLYDALAEYLDQMDPYRHPRTTSTWAPSARDCELTSLDIAQEHYYFRPSDREKLADEVEAVLRHASFLREHAPLKPAWLGEFGLADEKWGLAPEMAEDTDLLHFHNALWASALSGLSGTAMFWWWDQLDRQDAYPVYRPLAEFLADVPWTSGALQPTTAQPSDPAVRVIGLQSPDSLHAWLVHQSGTWSAQRKTGTVPEGWPGGGSWTVPNGLSLAFVPSSGVGVVLE